MNICIIGTARSGTTAIYTLLQKILVDNFPRVTFYYEPFLWDTDTFNAIYEKVNSKFGFINSISSEGIYNHVLLPLFMQEKDVYIKNEYLESIFKRENGTVKLIKFIRANGRIRFLAQIDPDIRFIFIMRNPLDVVNSLNKKFSFYGGEFYRDDYPRFIHEINQLYNLSINPDEALTYQEKLLLFWKYMNLFALESLKSIKNESLLLCQEELSADPAGILESICHFLQIPLHERYFEYVLERKSEVTSEFIVSQKELDIALPYLGEYINTLKAFNIQHHVTPYDVINKYTISAQDIIVPNTYYGRNALNIATSVSKMPMDLTSLRKENVRLNNEIVLLKQQMATILSQHKDLKNMIAKIKTELSNIKNKRLFGLLKLFNWK